MYERPHEYRPPLSGGLVTLKGDERTSHKILSDNKGRSESKRWFPRPPGGPGSPEGERGN